MAHIKGMFVTRGFPLPTNPGTFTLTLPDTDFRVHAVVAEGDGSVMVVEYALPADDARDVHFESVADDVLHAGLPPYSVYIGSYYARGAYLHVYGPRGGAHGEGPSSRVM